MKQFEGTTIPAKLNVGQKVQFCDGNSLVVAFRKKESQRKAVRMRGSSEEVNSK